jgi:glycosyltransferase involved in cell wall biosynthesis
VRLEFLRNRGLSPASLIARAQGKGRLGFSQRRLKQFAREMQRVSTAGLPPEPPESIALVVPCFKHAAYLPEMLDSVVSQTRAPDEVIFVDDCSPDATGDTLKSFIAKHSGPGGVRWQVLVNDRNAGQAASLNRGIEAASTDLIMILNDDDYLMHDAVDSQLGLFRQHRDVALIGAEHVGFAGRDALAAAPKLSSAHATPEPTLVLHRPDEVLAFRYVDQLDMTHSGLCFRKSAWERVGGYQVDKKKRVTRFSDRDFQLRVAALWPIAIVRNKPFAFWRKDSSVDGPLNS